MYFSNTSPGGAEHPDRLDAETIGCSIFGNSHEPPGPQISGYTVLRFIALGGLGNVWQGIRDSDELDVALKIPHEADAEPAERLITEARVLEHLRHPGIVRLIELMEDNDGNPVLVMELVRGSDLSKTIPPGGMGFQETVSLFLPLLEAVAYAHAHGVVHRDIKPANILISLNGLPKVADFGLAKFLGPSLEDTALTLEGLIAGTMEYVAPERFEQGTPLSAAVDIYSLGIMLYEVLTGQPPRGAWLPLSQVKKLDMRLDQLITDAIHPNPAKRLKSAALFSRRLKEIQKTRPRYAGTPMVTRPVRVADAAWTLAGLYCAMAGFFSLRRLNGAGVPDFFDLSFGHARLLGGFCSSWILTLLQGVLWSWQGWRLWAFRKVQMRESLPAPFGLQLGATRGAAGLVSVAQIACVWFGFFCLADMVFQTNHWITAETPLWQRGLCVTAADDPTPVSPWSWDPARFFDATAYWIREVQPGFKRGEWQQHDRQCFLIFIQPFLMTLGVAGILLGVVMTTGTMVMEWRWRRRKMLALLLCLLAGGIGIVWMQFTSRKEQRRAQEENAGLGIRYSREVVQHQDGPHWNALVRNAFDQSGSSQTLHELVGKLFAKRITHEQMGVISRQDLLDWLLIERGISRKLQRVVEDPHFSMNLTGDPFPVRFCFENYSVQPEGRVAGRHVTLRWRGQEMTDPPGFIFNQWDSDSVPLYEILPRIPDQAELNVWLNEFLLELGEAGCPNLEDYLQANIMIPESGNSGYGRPEPRASVVEAFRLSRERWASLQFYLVRAPDIRALSGGRWEITALINRLGIRPDGENEQPDSPMTWRMEIVPVKILWRILRLDM